MKICTQYNPIHAIALSLSLFVLTPNIGAADVLINYSISNAWFSDAGRLTGVFTYDVTTDSLVAWSLVAGPGGGSSSALLTTTFSTYDGSNAIYYGNQYGIANLDPYSYLIGNNSVSGDPTLLISTTSSLSSLSGGNIYLATIQTPYKGYESINIESVTAPFNPNAPTSRYLISGQLAEGYVVSTVPLPTSIITFVSGLLGLVALRRVNLNKKGC